MDESNITLLCHGKEEKKRDTVNNKPTAQLVSIQIILVQTVPNTKDFPFIVYHTVNPVSIHTPASPFAFRLRLKVQHNEKIKERNVLCGEQKVFVKKKSLILRCIVIFCIVFVYCIQNRKHEVLAKPFLVRWEKKLYFRNIPTSKNLKKEEALFGDIVIFCNFFFVFI